MIFSSLSLYGVPIVILREDLNHPIVSGNKLHKLKPNLNLAKEKRVSHVVSFGGAYSNHLHALAWACKESNLNSIGVIRGELHDVLTPTLKDCQDWGMQLMACPRTEFRAYQQVLLDYPEPQLLSDLPHWKCFKSVSGNPLVIPEGGSNQAAIDNLTCVFKTALDDHHCDGISHAVCATGTGATVAGLYQATLASSQASKKDIHVIGMQAVAEGQATFERIQQWLKKPRPQISRTLSLEASHFGGFAKTSKEIINFIDQFEQQHQIPLDPVYNGKAMFQLSKMIEQGAFQKSHKILFIHTGGLQGKRTA